MTVWMDAQEKIQKTAPMQKELANGKTVTKNKKFIGRIRFMESSLSNLVGILLKDFTEVK